MAYTPCTEDLKRIFVNQLSTARANAKKAKEREKAAAAEAAKEGTAPSPETNTKTKTEWFNDYGVITTRYLQQVHQVKTINGLSKKLNAVNFSHDSAEKNINLSFRTIDAIIKSCEKWRKYLADQESFDLLVCLEVISMAKIHASVISARNFSRDQGSLGVRLKEDVTIPHLFTTVVSYHGLLQVFS